MKPPIGLILALLFLSKNLLSQAQNQESNSLQNKYENYYSHFRETIHLHLNKTTFFEGEEVWWKAYAYHKKTSTPAFESTNLYCGLYDEKGKQIERKLFLLKNGVGHGSFKIDSTLNSGTYYIKATTTWMKNFKDETPYIQAITVVNDKPILATVIDSNKYDFQILPEGGHLVVNAENMVGIRLVDQRGKGIIVRKGIITNDKDEQVRSFHTNEFGFGKFILNPKPNERYKVKAILDDGNSIEKSIPKAKAKGIVMAVNNILEDKLVISIRTNKETLPEILNDSFHIAVHRDGIMTLSSFNIDSAFNTIKIDKKKLKPGINIITLFDSELNPISERLVFNYTNINIGSAKVEPSPTKSKDSVFLKINTFSKKMSPMSLSVSVLPAATIANNPTDNILTNFLLSPYLKFPVENPSWYFSEVTRAREYELDLVLLTQGWSRYDWGAIFNQTPKIEHPFEFGITAVGKIKTKLKNGETLALMQSNANPMLFLELKDSISFTLTNLLLENGDKMKFSIRKKRGGLYRPDLNIDFNILVNGPDSIPLTNFKNHKRLTETIETEDPRLIASKDFIQLDEVVVEEEKIENKLTRKHPLINSAFTGFKIGEKEIRQNATLLDFIEKNGFSVDFVVGTGELTISNRRAYSSQQILIDNLVRVYDDDFLVNDLTQLLNVPMNQIDEIYIERDGLAGDAFNSSNGVIRIYRKEGSTIRTSSSTFVEKLVKNSFTRPKDFYRPKYAFKGGDTFEKYGIVHWEPQLKTNTKGEVEFKIPKEKLSSVKVFIEGMGEDGSLLSHTEEISLD